MGEIEIVERIPDSPIVSCDDQVVNLAEQRLYQLAYGFTQQIRKYKPNQNKDGPGDLLSVEERYVAPNLDAIKYILENRTRKWHSLKDLKSGAARLPEEINAGEREKQRMRQIAGDLLEFSAEFDKRESGVSRETAPEIGTEPVRTKVIPRVVLEEAEPVIQDRFMDLQSQEQEEPA